MRHTYLITCEKDRGFHKQLQWLLDHYGQEWRGEEESYGLNWYEAQSGHPAESAEEMTKELRLACVERSIDETVVEERSISEGGYVLAPPLGAVLLPPTVQR